MATFAQFRCAVDGAEALAALRAAPLPLKLAAEPTERSFHRDIYLDTPDRALARRGVACRLRLGADDRRLLCLIVGGGAQGSAERWEAEVPDLDPRRALEGATEPARRLRGLVDPGLLRPRIEMETERWTRRARSGWLRPVTRFAFLYDRCTVRHAGLAQTFEEVQVRRLASGQPRLEQVAAALEREHGLRPLLVAKHERAAQMVEAMAAEATARMLASQRAVALVVYDQGAIAFEREPAGTLILPTARGSGEDACRHLLRHLFGSGVAELSLLGHAGATGDRPALEVWVARKIRGREDGASGAALEWLTLPAALTRVGTAELRAPETLGALALAARADLMPDRADRMPDRASGPVAASPAAAGAAPADGAAARPARPSGRPAAFVTSEAPSEQFLNVELAQLAFHERVLSMAEDEEVPLAERLRYLAIVSGNLDEFFAVRVGSLKAAIAAGSTKRTFDGLSPSEQFDAIAARVPAIVSRQARAAASCLDRLAERGLGLRRWDELTPAARAALTAHFERELLPVVTPRAVTLSPGHPFPVIPDLTLAFAVLVRDLHTGPVHFAYLPIPNRLARFVPVPGDDGVIPVEAVIRANLQAFYPERPVEQSWIFRVTRGADLDVNEEDAGDLLQAIEEEVRRRTHNAPTRLEVERDMPPLVRDLLLKELRFERRGAAISLGAADGYEIETLPDLTALRRLADRLPAGEGYPAFTARKPFPATPDLFAQIDAGDRLVHHPFDDFGATVGRFLEEAAVDPTVVAIKMTLYRAGDTSPVIDALVEAARRGKDVAVFVELKARFDEARNVHWVRRLEEAGAQVVYGLVGLKTHAKCALVVRQSEAGIRRYAHIGTGNYNAATARFYTDLGLFTADPTITADLGDLFNQLTGSSGPPVGSFRALLVSPGGMVGELLRRIDREVGFVRSGHGGRIRIQVNGIEDPEIVSALYRAAAAGVSVDLVVRGLSVLKPGVPGLSERIRVRSVVGRFLEHQRIFHFGNGGADEYLLGSADLRPRNLRRRVEVLVPVKAPSLTDRLDRILSALLAEPRGWVLDGEGHYTRAGTPGPEHPHVHERFLADALR